MIGSRIDFNDFKDEIDEGTHGYQNKRARL
jgi:hypothetical protein